MVNSGGGAQVRDLGQEPSRPRSSWPPASRWTRLGSRQRAASGFGDPIVLYDRFAERWMLSEFSSSGNNRLCVYVSQTSDPVSRRLVRLRVPPRRPSRTIRSTASGRPTPTAGDGSYVVTANDGGPGIYALDRGAMLTGCVRRRSSASRFRRCPRLRVPRPRPRPISTGRSPRPSGAPAIIARQRDTENHGGPAAPGDLIEMWSFEVDWVNSARTPRITAGPEHRHRRVRLGPVRPHRRSSASRSPNTSHDARSAARSDHEPDAVHQLRRLRDDRR